MPDLNKSQYTNEEEAVRFTIKMWVKIHNDIKQCPDIPLSESKGESYVLNGYNMKKDTAMCPLCAIYSSCNDCALFGKLQAKGNDYLPVDSCGDAGSAFNEALRIKDKDERLNGAAHIVNVLENYLEQLK